jgi:signal transduction histidine kinase
MAFLSATVRDGEGPPDGAERLDKEKNERRRRILVQNTSLAVIGYFFPVVAYFIVRRLNLASYSFEHIFASALWILVSGIVFYLIIRLKRTITIPFINAITFLELFNWVLIYYYLVSFLNEIRVSALLCAFMGIIFLLPSRGFVASILLSCSVAAGYTLISYYQIYYGGQSGIFAVEFMYVCFFVFAAVYVAWAAERFARQRKEVVVAKRRAETASRTKSEFLANMSHELRTPLNHIMGFTELVADGHVGDVNETQREYLGDVLHSSRHLLSLINDILDLSKVEAGKMALDLGDVKLKEVLERSLLMIQEVATKRSIRVQKEMNGIPETIRADERKLKQILYNLLSNAVKFSLEGGIILLKAATVQAYVRPGLRKEDSKEVQIIRRFAEDGAATTDMRTCLELKVEDKGIGIKPQDLERIFERFERPGGLTVQRSQGTGLGLSLTRELVRLHGGEIWAESGGEAKGSCFVVLLPIQKIDEMKH